MTNDTELDGLLNRVADGLADADDERRLAEVLRSDPQARRSYREFMALHSALHWDYAAAATPEPAAPAGVTVPRSNPRRMWFLPFGAGALLATAAATVVFLVGPMFRTPEPTDSPGADRPADARETEVIAALLVDGVGAEFARGRGPDGVRFGPGDYELTRGVVHLRFTRGADMVLAAPARIAIVDSQRTRLVSGKVRVVAPPTAKGFTIATPSADYVDLGTEFGLRVDPAGADLYVFDGQVDVKDVRSGAVRSVTAGQSSRTVDGRPEPAPPLKEGDFPTPGAIGLKRWEHYEREMRQDRSLLAFFPFRRQADESLLVNAVDSSMGDGRISGARWTTGRWPGKDALLFDRDTDLVRLTIPGEHRELTVAAWVKVERIDFVLNAILNSDGYEPGGIHFQLNRQGFPRGGVVVEGSFHDVVLGRAVTPDRWVHVASVISAKTRTQQIYVNGLPARERRWDSDVLIRPGSCRIGNWLPDPKDKFPTRALRGQIDELAVWGRVLPVEEVGRLVEAGRPGMLWSKE